MMANILEVFNDMKDKFNPSAATGLDLVFQFDVEDGDTYHLIVKDGTCEIVEGANDDPNVTLIMDTDTLVGVMTGTIDGMQAFMMGKLRAEGDMLLATKLGDLFPS